MWLPERGGKPCGLNRLTTEDTESTKQQGRTQKEEAEIISTNIRECPCSAWTSELDPPLKWPLTDKDSVVEKKHKITRSKTMLLFSKRNCIVFFSVLAVLLVLAAIAVGVFIFVALNYGVDDAYALWGAADMVTDYMKTHDGNWPRSWNDLEPQFRVNNGHVGGWSYSKFQNRVNINFDADPEQLRQASLDSPKATFEVIWPTYKSGCYIGDGPNQMLCNYFRKKAGKEPKEPLSEKTNDSVPIALPAHPE